MYAKSIGRYRKWADFEKLVMAVFTTDGFKELNWNNAFLEKDGDLYLLGATGMPRYGYVIQKDIFELINSSENEIKFSVTGHFYDDCDSANIESEEKNTVEVKLTKTSDGWRFSKFAVVWG
jgi:hypothetical protein